ncbi:MAG: DMT family transporter [Candidatus Fermentibacteraceae bacterium]
MKTIRPGGYQGRARLHLLLTAAVWGMAFTAQRAGMEHMGPLLFNGIRFLLGALVLVPFFSSRVTKAMILPAIAAGTVLFAGASLQQWGMVHTTASRAGFITGLYIVFVPLLGAFSGEREPLTAWVGFALALVGLFLLSFKEGFDSANPGDVLVLLGAFAWAFHVRLIGRLAQKLDPGGLALCQFTVCGVISLLIATFIGEPVRGVQNAVIPLAYSGFLSVGLAFTLQVFAQKRVRPSEAGALMALEAVFAALGGWLILHESLSPVELSGCLLMLLGTLLAARGPAVEPERH